MISEKTPPVNAGIISVDRYLKEVAKQDSPDGGGENGNGLRP
jgi:hypothetical protein